MRHFVFMAVLAASAAGCAVGPNYRTPTVEVPARYRAVPIPTTDRSTRTEGGSATEVSATAIPPDVTVWWHALADPTLDGLVERAVKANLDLDIALARLDEARASEAAVVGHALPTIDATGAAARGTGSDLMRGRAEQGLVSADNSQGLQHVNTIGGFDAAWEIDLFGRYRRQFQAAKADAQAAVAARNAVLITVIADVVRAYVDLRGLQVRTEILTRASNVLRESLRIVDIRYQRGITNELDVALARRELATFEARIEPLNAQVHAAQNTLAVLLGTYPDAIEKDLGRPSVIPVMPPVIEVGAPLDLLKRRPDIQEAERRLAAATARVGVATASLFPEVSLVGSWGSQSQGWGTSPDIGKHIWSFGPGAVWPVLDFGALDAQVERADFEAKARLAEYRRSIISAVGDVDSAVVAYQAEQARMHKLGDAMEAATRASELANQRYDRGLTDFLNVVDAERQLYTLQEDYDTAQTEQAEQYVKLYKSLGGGWENYQAVPAIRVPQPAVVAAFRSLFGTARQ